MNLVYTLQKSTIGNHTFAVIRGVEEYEMLAKGLQDVLNEVNYLINNPYLLVCDKLVELTFFLGSDYKVKLNKIIICNYIVMQITL